MTRWRMWSLVALLVWMLVVAWWATRPVSDSVPTGVVDNVGTTQTVQCDSPLSGNTTSTAALPVLHAGRSYQRTPCEMPITNDRIIFWVDAAVVLAAVVILAKTWKPSSVSTSSDDVAVA